MGIGKHEYAKPNKPSLKTCINKADAKKWAKQVEVELDKGSLVNLALVKRATFKEVIERYITDVCPQCGALILT